MVTLHFELMSCPSMPLWRGIGQPQPATLLDPTPALLSAAPGAPTFELAAFDGRQFVDPEAERQDSRWWKAWGGDWETGGKAEGGGTNR